MEEVKLTVAQVAKEIGESTNIVRNWLRDFRDYIPLDKSPGGYNLFNQESMNVITNIQKMSREQNLTTRQIEAILSGAGRPTAREEPEKSLSPEIEEIKEMLREQRDFNRALLDRLDEQNRQFENFVKRRDEQVLLSLREIRESKKKPGIWSKLWSKDRQD